MKVSKTQGYTFINISYFNEEREKGRKEVKEIKENGFQVGPPSKVLDKTRKRCKGSRQNT